MNCEINSINNIPCNGHGACVTARTQEIVSENAPNYFWHDMNKGLEDRIFFCKCDVGYNGYDCSLRSCAQGKDPLDDVELEYDCSNHGVCNKRTGLCSCFRGWGGGENNGINAPTGSVSNKCARRLPIHFLRRH